MKHIAIVDGPNLGRLGTRQPHIYGTDTRADILARLEERYAGRCRLTSFQSNHEGEIIDRLYLLADEGCQGVVLNAGALTHTSLALADCIAALPYPVVEVHISNIFAREPLRRTSLLAPVCRGIIAGMGTDVYRLGVEALL